MEERKGKERKGKERKRKERKGKKVIPLLFPKELLALKRQAWRELQQLMISISIQINNFLLIEALYTRINVFSVWERMAMS